MADGIPAFVQVGPIRYSVVVDQVAIDRVSAKSKSDLATQRIVLAPDLGEDVVVETLVHEVLHTLTHLVSIDGDLEDDAEEQIVTRLAPALIDCLRRNPTLVDAIVGVPGGGVAG